MTESGLKIRSVLGGSVIALRVFPGSKKESIEGLREGALKVRVGAPPEDNRANRAVAEALADFFGVKRNMVEIVSGLRSKNKEALIKGAAEETIRRVVNGKGA